MLETAFTLLGTAVTWLEVIAFVLALANIACNVLEIHWGWPLTIVASALYAWLFYASKLYGEAGVNVFFAVAAVWGWWQWLHGHRAVSNAPLRVARLDRKGLVLTVGAWAILWIVCALLLRSYGCREVKVAETNPLRRASIGKHTGYRAFDPLDGATASAGPQANSTHFVIDAVGSVHTRKVAFEAVRPGGAIMHIGLQDWASEIDMRKLTLAEITLLGTYTYSTADLRATVAALHGGAFDDLDKGRSAAAKIVLRPH